MEFLKLNILLRQLKTILGDLEVERQMADCISFMAFLDFPGPFLNSRTIRLFREGMTETGKDKIVWAELQRQLNAMGLLVKRGTIQDLMLLLKEFLGRGEYWLQRSKELVSYDGYGIAFDLYQLCTLKNARII